MDGIRVHIIIVREGGIQDDVTVTVNIGPESSPDDAMLAAVAFAESGGPGRWLSGSGPGRVLEYDIAAFVEGGYADPAVSLP